MQPDYSDVPRNQILCVDMKSFYASIELVKRNIHPLKGYLAVIGDKKRKGSVVLAASAALKKKYGDPLELAVKIKKEIWNKYGLPCSMGIGPNMFMAKVAMDNEGKKTGLCRWEYSDIPDKLWPLNLSDCWGIGSRTEKKLNKIGVYTVGELAQLPLEYLENKFGIIGNQLYYHAWGIDYSEVEGHFNDRKKGVGRGITLYNDYTDLEEIKTVIFNLAEEVSKRVRQHNLKGKLFRSP